MNIIILLMANVYEHNLNVLSNIDSSVKLYVDKETDMLYVDDRYFLGIRRWYTSDSRVDLIEPIKKTLEYYKSINKLALFSFLNKIKPIFKEIYPDYEDLHTVLNSVKSFDRVTLIDDFVMARVQSTKNIDVITTDQIYSIRKSGFVLFTIVGGGAGGGVGGTSFRGGGGSGNIETYLLYFPSIERQDCTTCSIHIGKGGSGGTFSKDIIYKPSKGGNTLVNIGLIKIVSNGGTFSDKSLCGGHGFSGGGAGAISSNGGAGGSSGKCGDSVDKYIGGQGSGTMSYYITFGEGGRGGNHGAIGFTAGGGGGGLQVEGYDIKAGDGIIKDVDNNGCGGIGFGAGGGGGSYSKDSYGSNYYCNGGSGANGCVIIEYVDYEF